MKTYKMIFFIAVLQTFVSCKKSEFLDKKPSTDIVQPTTLSDFQALLDNTDVMNFTGGLAQLASDDYTVSDANWATGTNTERNSYIWAKDIFAGDVGILDWNQLYAQVFYANVVLDGLQNSPDASTANGQFIKGWALFTRAYAFYDLTRNFCKAYDAGTAPTDLGIPLRLTSGIDYLKQRATLQQTFDQILSDLTTATNLLPSTRPAANLNRPSKIAAYALLARIYLDMRDYNNAQSNAEKSLALYNTLIDYNTVSTTAKTPFSNTNDELIYISSQVVAYSDFTGNYTASKCTVSPDVINLYSANDLRLLDYFAKNPTTGSYTKKRGYNGVGSYAFTGLATDEVYLIDAECLARAGQTSNAMGVLNKLLINRFNNSTSYVPLTATSSAQALDTVLLERRKELIWRNLRWPDLKRLNKEGSGTILSRVVNGTSYTIAPNDPRYVFPIPNDEIALSGIQQNER